MADPKKPTVPGYAFTHAEQEQEMRRLELGEAWDKSDMERVNEITQEMQDDGVRGIGNEHYRAQEAFAEFEEHETARQQGAPFEPETPDLVPEYDPQRTPAQDPAGPATVTPARETERDPDRLFTYADLKREQAEVVARLEAGEDLDTGDKKLSFFGDYGPGTTRAAGQDNELSDIGEPGEKKLSFFGDKAPANSQDLGQGGLADAGSERGEKRLRFYGELKQEHADATGKENDRADGADQEKGDAGEKQLSFFEDRNKPKGLEHGR